MTDAEILALLLFCLLINFALMAAVWLRIIYESAFAPVTPSKSHAEIRSDLDKIKRDVDKNTAWLSGGKKQPTPIIVCAAHRHRDLFLDLIPPRKKSRVMMHVVDAGLYPDGRKCIRFKCQKCDHDTGMIYDEQTVSQNKRGMPCPVCNKQGK